MFFTPVQIASNHWKLRGNLLQTEYRLKKQLQVNSSHPSVLLSFPSRTDVRQVEWWSAKNVKFILFFYQVDVAENQRFYRILVPSCILIKGIVGILSRLMAFQSAWSVIVVLVMAWLPTVCPQTVLISYLSWSQMEKSDPRWNSFCFCVSFSPSVSSAFSIGRQLWGTVLSLSGGNWFELHSSAFFPLFFVHKQSHRRARLQTCTHTHGQTHSRKTKGSRFSRTYWGWRAYTRGPERRQSAEVDESCVHTK